MYSIFWVIPRRLPIFRDTLMKMEHTECSETSVHKIQTPGNHPKERIQHSEHGESLKLRKSFYVLGGLLATKWHQCCFFDI